MKLALSTNWCNRTMEAGEEIAERALELGFDELELGFHTSQFQVEGFRRRLDRIPVGSIHAFCPVPISAPQGYPELYQLASFDEETRKMAQLQIRRNVAFAADIGADTVVLHAGRVYCYAWFKSFRRRKREKRGVKMTEIFKQELETLIPELEKHKVVLGLENLPYFEGYPDEREMTEVAGEWVRPWYDTGHGYVRQERGYLPEGFAPDFSDATRAPIGIHLNDSNGGDDHLAPGDGKIDFAALRPWLLAARHLVFEPNAGVVEEQLRRGMALIRGLEAPPETIQEKD